MTNLVPQYALRPVRSGLRALALCAALALCGAASAPAVATAAEADPHGPAAEAPTVAADHAVERVGTFGLIDWTTMRAVATGTGVPPATAADPARARAMAERAAMLDARRNLLEVVGSVRMDAQTMVRDFMTASDTVRSAVAGVLRGAQIEALTLRPDGSVRAVASLPLTGNLVEVLRSAPPLAPRAAPGPGPAVAPAPAPASGPDPAAREALARSRSLELRVAALEAELAEQRRASRTMAARLDELDRLLDEAARLNRQEAQQQAQQQAGVSDVEGRAAADRDAALAAQFETLRAAHRALAERLRHLEERPVPAPSAVAAAAPAPAAPPLPAQPVPSAPPAPAPSAAAAPTAPTSAPLPGPTPEQAAALGHTGIVVDARGLNFTPSLNPRLADATGATLYPPPDADGAGLARRGAVRYFRDLSQAQRSARAGASPLTIKPAGLAADGGLTLGDRDAALLRALAGAPHTPVRDLNVVVVF
ncbi:MAG: hypothetical protein H0S85_13135 [Desulfovibrionaceae bacterium]|jgi:hypothetical protein|nr:hypothetical protein [Desulfovibrionaceae bacterium]